MLSSLRHLSSVTYQSVPLLRELARRQPLPLLAAALAVSVVYFAAAKLGLALLVEPEDVAVFWPASGLAAGALVYFGPQASLPVALGVITATFAANMINGRGVIAAIVFGLCNAGEALLLVWMLGRGLRSSFGFAGVPSVVRFFGVTVFSTALVAIPAAFVLYMLKGNATPIVAVWREWFLSDAIGVIAIAPFLITLAEFRRKPPKLVELQEGGAYLTLLALATTLIYGMPAELSVRWIPVPIGIAVPLLLLIATRCRPPFLAAGLLAVALIIVSTMMLGFGRLGDSGFAAAERIYAARFSIAVVAFCGLVLMAVLAERWAAENALRESEEHARLALDCGQMGTWDWDLRSDMLSLDSRDHKLLGGPPAEMQMSFRTFLERVHPDDRQHIEDFYRYVVLSTDTHQHDFRIVLSSGETRWIAGRGRAIHDDHGHPIRVVGVDVDITERKKAEQELEGRVAERTRQLEHEMRLREEAQAAYARSRRMQELGQLSSGIAHDFNNLLGVIGGNLQLAESKVADTEARRRIGQAIAAVELGAHLNRRLLTFSARRKLAPDVVALNVRLSEMRPLLRQALGRQVTLEMDLQQDLWPIEADPGGIEGAIINLALNARDAMPSGGRLTITSRNLTLDEDAAAGIADARPGEYVCVSVTDTGHGMTPEVRARAMEPFFTTKKAGKGTGLGLSSVAGFCGQAGGFLTIASDLAAGTAVSLHLPKTMAASALAGYENPAAAAIVTGDGEIVLVIEDNREMRDIAMGLLEDLHYTVIEACDGLQAIGILQSGEAPALVFSDVLMPGGMSGYDVAQWVRENRPSTAVLLTSGNNEVDPASCEVTAGLTVLAKPYNREQLARAVRSALGAIAAHSRLTSPVKT